MKNIVTLFILLLSFFSFSISQTPIIMYNSVTDTTYINKGFSYFIGKTEPDSGWKNINFDDSNWNKFKSSAVIGYGWPTLPKVNTISIDKTPSLFLRIKFNVDNIWNVGDLSFLADYDDGFIAYLNGQEIVRVNLGKKGSPVSYNKPTDRSHESHVYRRYDAPVDGFYIDSAIVRSLLKPGENVFAIEVHNDSTADDLSFVCSVFNLKNSWYDFYNAPFRYYRQVSFDSSKFPIVIIETGQMGIPIVHTRFRAKMKVINRPGINKISDLPEYDGYISIERKGESSAWFPKMSFNVETQNPDSSNLNVSLLGMPAENDWVLFSSFADKSMIKTELVFMLGRKMGHYEPRTRYCELILNGEYMGMYYFMEKIKRDKNRVDVAKRDSVFPENGGYIFKYDKPNRKVIQYIYPDKDEISAGEKKYLSNYIKSFEASLKSPKFLDPVDGYRRYINPYSLIDYIIINELTKNCDAYLYSTYFHKDSRGVLNYGPLWDYDLAFGGASWQEGNLTSKWQFEFNTDLSIKLMLRDTVLKNRLAFRWWELRNTFLSNDSLFHYIDSLYQYTHDSRIMNYRVWPVEDKYLFGPDHYVASADEEILFIKDWLTKRLTWIDSNIDKIYYPLDVQAPTFAYSKAAIEIYPNPFVERIFVKLLAEEGSYTVNIYTLEGKRVCQQTVYAFSDEIKTIEFSGQDVQNLKRGMYILTVSSKGMVMKADKIYKQ
ncbi:MAG: CotH kinase family protein [Bacteroidales bacterium]|nr:CotH kinase family protein [Bacteroidales bacterium]